MTEKRLMALIDEMTAGGRVTSENYSARFRAYRKAEKLKDAHLYPVLKNIITANADKGDESIRDAASFIMGKLLRNSPSKEYLAFYIGQSARETDKHIASSMLDRLSETKIPSDVDISPIIAATQSKDAMIRHNAIKALGSADTDESRDVLRRFLEATDEKTYKYEIINANAALSRIGVPEDIPLIEHHLESRIADIRDSASFAREAIQKRKK